MKKLLALTLAALMVFGMVACASNNNSLVFTNGIRPPPCYFVLLSSS